MNICPKFLPALLTVAAFGMLFQNTGNAIPPERETRVARHCVVQAEAAGPGIATTPREVTSREKGIQCYPTLSEAVFAATDGTLWVPEDLTFPDKLKFVEKEMKSRVAEGDTKASFVSAIDYQHSSYGGSTLTWTSPGPCTSTTWFYKDSMPSGWDNVVSSTRGFSDCNQNILFEHTFRWGATQTCWPNCSSLGAMNDQTSSREFRF